MSLEWSESDTWFKSPKLLLPPDINLNFFNCPFNILLIFKILMYGTHKAFEFYLSF